MTTDWTAQAQAGVDRWLEAQRTWWTHVLGMGSGDAAGARSPEQLSADAARQAIEAWRTAAYRVVDAQAQALLGTLTQREPSDVQSLLRTWTDAQRELWQGWLAMAESTGGQAPQGGAPSLEEAGRKMVESLREAAEHLVRSQGEWAKAWSDAETPASKDDDSTQGGP